MKVQCALLVDEVRKHSDGRVDLLGLYEEVYLEQVPATLESANLFVDLEFEPEDRGLPHLLEIKLCDADGHLAQPPQRITFEVPPADVYGRPSAQLDIVLDGMTFPVFGDYFLDLVLDSRSKRRVYLGVFALPDTPKI